MGSALDTVERCPAYDKNRAETVEAMFFCMRKTCSICYMHMELYGEAPLDPQSPTFLEGRSRDPTTGKRRFRAKAKLNLPARTQGCAHTLSERCL